MLRWEASRADLAADMSLEIASSLPRYRYQCLVETYREVPDSILSGARFYKFRTLRPVV